MKFWSNSEIEALTQRRLREYEKNTGKGLEYPPIPIDLVIEHEPFDLKISWEFIEERPGETILGGLRPRERQIVMNEKHVNLFQEKPGLERFTKGHELGHWDLFIDKTSPNQASLPGLDPSPPGMKRRATNGLIEVLFSIAATKNEAYEFYREYAMNADIPYEFRAVNRYSSSLLMNRDLVMREIVGFNLMSWPQLYELARRFGVTISALCVRLDQLGLAYISKDGQIHRSKVEYFGQKALLL